MVDLDLEAPGLGAQLLPEADRPEFGVLDWLVEDLVGNHLAAGMAQRMVARTPGSEHPGLYVAPATGHATERQPTGFIAKLARAYLDSGESGGEGGFADRVRHLCETLEDHVHPDVVLIDSRAGLHETAATAVLHLDADVLLFATDQPPVWAGYRYLLAQLGLMARIFEGKGDDDWRLRFKMVHAKAGEAQWELDRGSAQYVVIVQYPIEEEKGSVGSSSLHVKHYLDRYFEHSYRLWLDGLYDKAPAGSDDDRFTFSIGDEAASHYPLTILADPRFECFNPLQDLTQVREAAIAGTFWAFAAGLDQRIFGDTDGS